MESSAIPTGSSHQALNLEVNYDVNDQLHGAFTLRFSDTLSDNIIHDMGNVPLSGLQYTQVFESWRGVSCNAPASSGWQVFHNDQYLLAAVPESLLQNLPIDQASEKAYGEIFQLLQHWEYPHLIRSWNFFDNITADGYAGSNNYQLFCSGRTRAYQQYQLTAQPYPAATVIGTQQSGLQIYFIAAKTPGVGIENTKQVSAFDYPASYSEDPPLFSRALLHDNHQQHILFISGTASITGHNTQYEGDINRQTDVCLENIQHLLTTAIHEHHFTPITLTDFTQFKVYIKDPAHFATVQTHLQHQLGTNATIIYLQGDMCRNDLAIEIEALAISPKL